MKGQRSHSLLLLFFCIFRCVQCLVKDARERLSIEQMAKHAFLRLHKGTNLADLLTWAMGDP